MSSRPLPPATIATQVSAPGSAANTAASPPALELLALGAPEEVLARLADGDPLGLGARVCARARERWLLVDPDRALARALAVVASRAPLWRGRPGLERWLAECVDDALDGLASEVAGPALPGPIDGRALARFHRLPAGEREAFCRVVLDGESPEALAASLGITFSELGRRARRALDTLLPSGPPAEEIP